MPRWRFLIEHYPVNRRAAPLIFLLLVGLEGEGAAVLEVQGVELLIVCGCPRVTDQLRGGNPLLELLEYDHLYYFSSVPGDPAAEGRSVVLELLEVVRHYIFVNGLNDRVNRAAGGLAGLVPPDKDLVLGRERVEDGLLLVGPVEQQRVLPAGVFQVFERLKRLVLLGLRK